ncbi:MAG TPA: hypothetical protein VNT99_13535 [Methylomirabilota bacterium]|nr:hypothetical protein [Methylomirabilota bacterium]
MNRIMIGVGVAMSAAFSVVAATQFAGHPWFEQHRQHLGIAAAGAGLVMALIGLWLRKAIASDRTSDEEKSPILDLRYWGPILIVLGAITLFIRPMHEVKAQTVSPLEVPAALVASPAAAQPASAHPTPPAAPAFPSVRIQGLILREKRPFAIINGKSYTIGDHVGAATIKAIHRDGVELELAGHTKLVLFNDTTGGRVAFSRERTAP